MKEPSLKARFIQLLSTESAIEFFFTLAGSLHGDLTRTYHEQHGYGMTFEMHQNLLFTFNNRDTGWQWTTTHSFSLYMDGTLTWTMFGQPTITGLKPIQQALERFQDQFNQATLPAQI